MWPSAELVCSSGASQPPSIRPFTAQPSGGAHQELSRQPNHCTAHGCCPCSEGALERCQISVGGSGTTPRALPGSGPLPSGQLPDGTARLYFSLGMPSTCYTYSPIVGDFVNMTTPSHWSECTSVCVGGWMDGWAAPRGSMRFCGGGGDSRIYTALCVCACVCSIFPALNHWLRRRLW